MNIQENLEELKNIYATIIDFIDDDDNIEEKFENFKYIIYRNHATKNHVMLELILQIISNIAKNHSRPPNFIKKIQKIILILKHEITKEFSNNEIFNFFKSQKMILLFLFDEKIITMNNKLSQIMTHNKYKNAKYPEYFYDEIKNFINEPNIQNHLLQNYDKIYDELRKTGENETYICNLIRQDLIENFIIHIHKNDISNNTSIEISIFETNSMLLKRETTLIEYAAFFGSFQIFTFLYKNNAKLSQDIWLYAIHSNNPEIINFLKNNNKTQLIMNYKQILEESIKCHHNDLANYILCANIIKDNKTKFYESGFHYHNHFYFPNDVKNKLFFFYACQYKYLDIVKYYLQKIKRSNTDIEV